MTLPKFRRINVQSYEPGKSRLYRIKNIVKLSANESALGVSSKVKKAIINKINFAKYPDNKSNNLRLVISKKFKCEFEKIRPCAIKRIKERSCTVEKIRPPTYCTFI